MKLAFVTTLKPRNGAFYGAETSLMYLIESMKISNPEIEISIIIRQPLLYFRRLNINDKSLIQLFFNLPSEYIHYTWLPYVSFPIEKLSFKSAFRYFTTNIIILFHTQKLIKLFNNFDHVHINNTHLYLTKIFLNKDKYSQHVRDYVYYKKFFKTNAKFLICIDKTTYRQISRQLASKSFILPNIYIPKISNPIESSLLKQIKEYNYVFCIVGQIAKIKGVEYVINEFISLNNSSVCLLVIGGVTDVNYYNEIKAVTSNCKNIFFTGDVSNVSEYYTISNFNIRGDEHFCIGRTTIESAIQGLINILPLKENETPIYNNDSINNLIQNNSVYYDARVHGSLKKTMENCINFNYKVKFKNFKNPSIEISKTFYKHIIK